jgi:hypothetical protein
MAGFEVYLNGRFWVSPEVWTVANTKLSQASVSASS